MALRRLEWLDKQKDEKNELSQNPYYSIDPAPPAVIKDVKFLKEKLLDESESMFERYRYHLSLYSYYVFSFENLKTFKCYVST